jgi:hypothetical protein
MAKTPERVKDVLRGLRAAPHRERSGRDRHVPTCSRGHRETRWCDSGTGCTTTPSSGRPTTGSTTSKWPSTSPFPRFSTGCSSSPRRCSASTSRRSTDFDRWHEDVQMFAIIDSDTGEEISRFYLDLFPREGKYGHAAEFPFLPSRVLEDGSYQNPICAMVTNFTKPTKDAARRFYSTERWRPCSTSSATSSIRTWAAPSWPGSRAPTPNVTSSRRRARSWNIGSGGPTFSIGSPVTTRPARQSRRSWSTSWSPPRNLNKGI